ncbi:hypothetical protein FOCG_08912 [Fusarium oxysporum f. sp. radicis-lycopersici 26381]|uniref:Uncharacterized protein n=1 Tax=Fusarium oxysporum Fo47 TaxID=660027 RepID=W9K406_FUSOX|nr:hypothetical protein FOZG_08318 [Fusarium oxysporum Fo47]EXL50687.1 hypothetical protein FOCG_08912 [Fusarium oxysporum f. sp. radicis-lycopersici 26381]
MFLDVYTRFHVSEDIFLVFSYPQRQSIPFQSLRPSGHLSPFSHSTGVERNRKRRDRYRSTIHPEVVQGKEASLSAVMAHRVQSMSAAPQHTGLLYPLQCLHSKCHASTR